MANKELNLRPFEQIGELDYRDQESQRLPREELTANAIARLYFASGLLPRKYFSGDIFIDEIDTNTRSKNGLYVISTTVNRGDGELVRGFTSIISPNHYVLSPKGRPYGFIGIDRPDSDFDNSLFALLEEEMFREYQ